MKRLFVAVAMFFSVAAVAAPQSTLIDVSSLTAAQREQIMQVVDQKKVEASVDKVDAVLTRVEQFGASAARGLVGFAKEIGAEANAFSKTPLGIVVSVVTVMHFFGSQITGMLVGTIFLFLVTPIFATLFVRAFSLKTYKYEYRPFIFGLWNRQVVVETDTRRSFEDAEVVRLFVFGLTEDF